MKNHAVLFITWIHNIFHRFTSPYDSPPPATAGTLSKSLVFRMRQSGRANNRRATIIPEPRMKTSVITIGPYSALFRRGPYLFGPFVPGPTCDEGLNTQSKMKYSERNHRAESIQTGIKTKMMISSTTQTPCATDHSKSPQNPAEAQRHGTAGSSRSHRQDVVAPKRRRRRQTTRSKHLRSHEKERQR